MEASSPVKSGVDEMAQATGSRCGGDGVPRRRRWDAGALSLG